MKKKSLFICLMILNVILINTGCESEEHHIQFKDVIGTNGIKYNQGLLWVTDLLGRSITAFDPQTGYIQKQFDFSPLEINPDDLVFMDDNTIIWTAPPQGIVGRINPNDEIVVLGRVGESVNPIERRQNSSDIYIGFESNGAKVSRIDINSGNNEIVVTDLPSINGFSFAEDGFLYAPIFDIQDILIGIGGVVKIDVDNQSYEELIVRFPDNPNKIHFVGATGIVADQHGFIYVLESLSPAVYKVNLVTSEAVKLASLPTFTTDNIALGENGMIYVTTFIKNEVFEVDPNGNIRKIIIKNK